MDLIVVDDSRQPKPARQGMGPLVAVGGLHVPSSVVGQLERKLEHLCTETGFPTGQEFKWSPGPELWMHKNLTGVAREGFFVGALQLAAEAGCTALIVVVDTQCAHANKSSRSPEEDALVLFLERAHQHLQNHAHAEALVLADRPSGDRKSEVEFLCRCMETMRSGTSFVLPDRLTLIVAGQSRLVRLLQLADLVAASSLAAVAGESKYSPPIFSVVKTLFRGGGGFALKIHPDGRYVNLYHWLLGDDIHRRYSPLPDPKRPYSMGPDEP